MPTVAVLYIDDAVVAPHLELLRNICDPISTSRPHVTVRYFDRLSIPDEYLHITITHLDLVEAGVFGSAAASAHHNATVFIRCESDELVALEHKPHYPASDLHITVYDGARHEFAERVLEVLRTVQWGFRIKLPTNTKLTRIEIKTRRAPHGTAPPRQYRPNVRRLFRRITGADLSWDLVATLPDDERLKLARLICDSLNRAARRFRRTRDAIDEAISSPATATGKLMHETEVHLTPPELARQIVEYAVEHLREDVPIDFGDPAVGTGAFYAALLQVVTARRVRSAVGVDINPAQVAAAKRRWSRKGMDVMWGDYLHIGELPRRNLVIANPPYLRHQSIPGDYKWALRQRASVNTGMHVNGRSGLYVYFMLLAHEWMAPEGVAAWLVPSEFMQTEYGASLREYLSRRVQLIRVHQFSPEDPQFENAKVLPAVVVFRNRRPNADDHATFTAGGTLRQPAATSLIANSQLRAEPNWHNLLRRNGPSTGRVVRLGDLFLIRRGIATGANEFFIIERTRARELGIPDGALRPVLPKVRALSGDIVERAPDGYPDVSPQLCLIDCALPDSDIRKRYPAFYEYLKSAEPLGILGRNLVRSRRPWYKQERRDPAPFLCTYMGRGRSGEPPLRFIWNKSDAVATNTYLLLYPREQLAQALKAEPHLAATIFHLLKRAARESLAGAARIHAGGLHKIEPSELHDVCLPPLPPLLHERLLSSSLLMTVRR